MTFATLLPVFSYYRGVGTGGGRGGGMAPTNVRGGGPKKKFAPPPKAYRGPIGLVFFTLENVLCLLFDSAIPGGEKA